MQTKLTPSVPVTPEEAVPNCTNDLPSNVEGADKIEDAGAAPNGGPLIRTQADQEIRSSIQVPTEAVADISVAATPQPPKRLESPGRAEQAECSVLQGGSANDVLLKKDRVIKDLLATLSRIAGSTALPADDLSAIAARAIAKHSRP